MPLKPFDGELDAPVGTKPFDGLMDGESRGAIGEILNQGKAGVVAELPKMAGQALQYASDPGNKLYDIGKSIADYGREQEKRPDLQPQEDRHNGFTNMLASGARMIPQSVVPAAAIGAGLAMASPLGRAATVAASSVLGALPAGMSQGQDTLEKAREKGIPEDEAIAAARMTGAIEWGGETIGNYAGARLLGAGARVLGKGFAGTAAEKALEQQTSTAVLKPFLKELPKTMATEVGTEMGQNSGEAAVEQAYGIDNKAPWEAAKEAILPTVGMTLLMAPFGGVGHAIASHGQAKRNAALADGETAPEQRLQIAQSLLPQIEAVDPQAAAYFRANVVTAVAQKAPLAIDGSLFADPAAPKPVPPEPLSAAATNVVTPPATPPGPMAAAAAKVAPTLFPFSDQAVAQKQADAFSNDSGIPHEVVPHPSVAGRFAAVPAKENSDANVGADVRGADLGPAGRHGDDGLDQHAGTGAVGQQDAGAGTGAGAGAQDAAGQAGTGQPDTAPVAFRPGEPVQVNIDGVDQFYKGARVKAVSDDGQSVTVETPSGNHTVLADRVTRFDPAETARMNDAAQLAATSPYNERLEPTDAMKEAGNYKKGSFSLQGLPLKFENPVASTRAGLDAEGTPWSVTMRSHYGYIRGTVGGDGQAIDAFAGANPLSHHVFVIDQIDPKTGAFDEHKVMLGFNSPEQARRAYDSHYAKDWTGGAQMHATTIDSFKQWLKQGDTTKQFAPAAETAISPANVTSGVVADGAPADTQTGPTTSAAAGAPTDGAAQALAAGAKVTVGDTTVWIAEGDAGWMLHTQAGGGMVKRSVYGGAGPSTKERALEMARSFLAEQPTAPAAEAAPIPTGTTTSAATGAPHELTREQYRADPARGQADGLPVSKIKLDKLNAVSLVAKHKDQVLALGKLMGAKGGQVIKKVAADIMRLHQLRTELAGETVESLLKQSAIALKALAKRVGTYAGHPKAGLAEAIIGWRNDQREKTFDRMQDAKHAMQVRAALLAGKNVPDAVLADYPQMAASHFPRGSAQYQAGIEKMARGIVTPPWDSVPIAIAGLRKAADEQTDPRKAAIQRDMADAAQAQLDRYNAPPKALPEGSRAWETTPFADRIKATLAALRGADSDAMARVIEAGSHADAVAGRLNEEVVAFREAKARETIAARQAKLAAKEDQAAAGAAQPAQVAQDAQDAAQVAQPAEQAEQAAPDAADQPAAPPPALNQDAVDHPEKYAFKGKLPALLIVKRAVAHLGDEQAFINAVKSHFHDLAAEGYPVLPSERIAEIEGVADTVLAGINSDKPAHYWQHPEFETLPELEGTEFPRKQGMFPPPAKSITLQSVLRDAPVLAQADADAIVAGWKAEAKRIGREQDNSNKVVISLFDRTGVMSQPYQDAGYTVFRYDLERGDNLLKNFPIADIMNLQESGHEIVGVIAQPPCTSFAVSGAWSWAKQHDVAGEAGREWVEKKYGHWASNYFDKPVEVAEFLVLAAKHVIELANPSQFYVLENPVGRIARIGDLPQPLMRVQPNQFGNAYTKTTQFWGEFNTDLPTALVSAAEADGGQGSLIATLRGSNAEQKQQRSVTPEGLAYAFFMANHEAGAAKETGEAAPAGEATPATPKDAQQPEAGSEQDQPVVHEYDAEQARPLLLIACSDGKQEGKHRAIDLYRGALFQMVHKWMPKGDKAEHAPDVYIISAKHGLIHADTRIDRYDQLMTQSRQRELIEQGVPLKDFEGKNFSEVFIAGSGLYRPIGDAFVAQLRAAGFVGPDAKVQATEGEIGVQRSQLGKYLRSLTPAEDAAASPAALAEGVRVRITAEVHQAGSRDFNRDAGRAGVITRGMVSGDTRYWLVKLDATPDLVERTIEMPSDRLEVLSEGNDDKALAADPQLRRAQIRERIDAALDANEQLVAQANLETTGNRFADFQAEYKAAFERELVGMLDIIPAEDYKQFDASLNKLPGYLSRAARQFITDHHGHDVAYRESRAAAEAAADATKQAKAAAVPAPVADDKPGLKKMQDAKAAKDAPPAAKDAQAATERRAERQAYQIVGTFPSVLAAAAGTADEFTAHASEVLATWVKDELAAANGDSARIAELNTLMADGKPTLSKEFFASLQKYAQRLVREADKAAARNPETYKQGLLDATIADKLPADADQVALYKAGFDHALAGRTKSTLLPGELLAKGYEAAQKWIKTDLGAAYYTGKQVNKLENTGEDLRRWFDKAAGAIKDASPDNMTAAWDTIKAQASRVDAFANLAGLGATPGTVRYLNELRDIVIPFQEWLMTEGGLRHLWGRYESKASPSDKLANFLDGSQYTDKNETPGQEYPGKTATPAERLGLLQREAARYMEVLRTLAGALQGAKTVADGAARYTKLMVAKPDEYYANSARYTAEGLAMRDFLRYNKGLRFETGHYYVDQAIKNEAKPDDPNQHKKPLVAPKLDRVVREGLPDHRKGKDVTPAQVKAKFGLADVGFGEYVKAKEGQDHLNYAYDAFMDLAKFLGIEPAAIGLGGKLHFTIGALGHGKAAAHFTYGQPDSTGKRVTVINLTNTRGDGTVAHEWFHALDHALNQGYRVVDGKETWIQHKAIIKVGNVLAHEYNLAHAKQRVLDFLTGNSYVSRGGRERKINRSNDAARIANAIDGIDYYTSRSRTTDYKKAADKLGEDYWGNPRELIARAAEAYVHDRMEGMNNYLVNPDWVAEGKIAPPTYKGTPYPTGEERQTFHHAYDTLVKALRFGKDGVTVDMDAFNAAALGDVTEYNAGLAAMRPLLPELLVEQRRAERAQQDAYDERQAARAAAEVETTLRIAYEARIKAELDAAAAAAPAPASTAPLTDAELDALLDAAEAELAEENANQPAAKEPGETMAAPAERWSREDYQLIRDEVEQGHQVIFANEKWAEDAGLPTIGDFPSAQVTHKGFGVFEVSTSSYTGNFAAGGSMNHTHGGQPYTTFRTTSGVFAYPKDEVLKFLNAKLIVKAGPKAAPTLQPEQDKKAATLIAEAAKMGVKGIDEALKGLASLFGVGPGKLQSFPAGFDEEAYKKAKPHFMASLKAFQAAGKSLQDLFKLLFAQLGAGVRPYAKQFAKDMALDSNLGAAPASAEKDALTVETAPAEEHTEQKEQDDDSTSVGNEKELDTPLVAGPAAGSVRPADPIRGAGLGDQGDRPADGPGVRGSGERGEGAAGTAGPVGDAGGLAAVPDGTPDAVGGNPRALPARDYRAGVADLERTGSWRDTAARNVDLIDLARAIEAEKRPATPAEQAQLARYVGFGAGEIRNKLFPIPNQYAKKQDPTRLIWPNEIADPVWRGLAERLAALPREWQESVLQSTQYAHYTSAPVVSAIWSAIGHLGFTGGKIMEPGMGIGSFPMLMPDGVRATSKYTGIEFDAPTALIAKLLSPQQNMLHDDFIKRRLPKDYFDLAIGNPPFAKTKVVADPEYAKHNFALHDYFFAKSIDRVRPGGLLVFVTSHYTMDKANDKARSYLADRADLLGALRLPQTAFQDNAGTTVVTDVLFLRKRDTGAAPAGVDWKTLDTLKTKDGDVLVNRYFVEHPDMILGQPRLSGNMDDMGRRINGLRGLNEFTVVSYDRDSAALEAKFAAAVKQLPANAYSVLSATPAAVKAETAKVDFDPSVKREGVLYLAKDGTVMRVEQGVGKALTDVTDKKLTAKDLTWLKDFVGLRVLVRAAQAAQYQDAGWEKPLKALNTAYDKFVKTHGPIGDYTVSTRSVTDEEGHVSEVETRRYRFRRLYSEDYDAAIVTQLERVKEDGSIVKAPFLLGRTIGKPVVREIKTIGDALAVSLDERGSFDLDDVARRIGLSNEDALEALGSQVYENPQGQMELADAYLSGDVVSKLEEARVAAHDKPALERNVAALMAVQPQRLGPSQITVKLGASWVPEQYVNAFAFQVGAGEVKFDRKTESWQVEGGNERTNRSAANDYGTAARSPAELLEAVLNSRSIVIKHGKSAGDMAGKTDAAATTSANEKAKKIRDDFKSWVWQDSERATDLVDIYNTVANNLAPRKFNGDHLTLPGVSMRYKLFAHQKQAIWRVIQTGDTYLAHAVGAGKTIEMVAAAMEQKRLGLIKKPMFVVPNHMLDQFANEFMELYPLANIMVADDQNFKAERRRAFIAAATLNAPDAVIITHSAFKMIGVREESVGPIRDEIINDLEADLAEIADDNGQRVRRSQLEQQIEAVKQRFDKVLGIGGKDNSITFEDIGADQLIVDEAHNFRKLDFATNMQIKGIDPNGSQAALGMYVKTRYLQKVNPGRAMVFASGTPVTNTMGELYTVMRFFAPQVMAEMGISTFDGWARMFGEVATALEPNATGRYENVERFSKFSNIPELMSRVRQFMDVLNSEHLGALVKRPDIEGGKPDLIIVPASASLKQYMADVLTPRLERSRKWKPSPQEPHNPDPVLNIITDGKFAALDPRFFGGAIAAGESSKLNRMAEEIVKEYHATADETFVDDPRATTPKPDPVKGATQIVFYNLGFGISAKTNRGFDARATLTKMLTAGGVKREQIAFFDDADTDAKKEAVFKAMRAGQIRILVGSAKKMGTGVNVQKRLSALHYFDPPWYPSDIEQPHGRIIRQGNQHEDVRIKWYSTKGTYDETMWQMVARKQRFIDQAFSGDASLRSMDDLSEASLYEQAAAMSSGDPRAIQLAGLRQDVERLERLQAAHSNEQVSLRGELRNANWTKEFAEKDIKTLGAAFKALGETHVSFNSGTVDGKQYDSSTDFGDALRESFNAHLDDAIANMGRAIDPVATLPGMTLTMVAQLDGKDRPNGDVALEATVGPKTVILFRHDKPVSAETVSGVGLTRSIFTMANSFSRDLDKARETLAKAEVQIIRLAKKVGAPFGQMADMVEKNRELLQLEDELRADGKTPAAATGPGFYRVTSPEGAVNDRHLSADDIEQLRLHHWKLQRLADPAAGATLLPGSSGAPGRLQRRNEDRARRAGDPQPDAKLSRGVAGPGMAPAAVRQVVDPIVAGWAKAPPVTVVATVAALPFKAPADTRGALHGGRVYLVAANLHSAGEAQFVLGHEALGHLGLRSIMALPQLAAETARLREANPALAAAAREQVRRHGYDLTKATEEALADIAGSGVQLKGWQRFAAAVQKALRKLGLHQLADWMEGRTQAETMALLGRARAAVETGATGTAAATATAQLSDAGGGHWYSTLARQIEKTVTKSASPLHWGETIMGGSFAQKGVKQEEIEWSGVLDWLNVQKEAGVAKVSREQLLNYLAGNGVQVSETFKGEPDAATAPGVALRKAVFDQYQPQIEVVHQRAFDYSLPSREQDEAHQELEELYTERDRAADAAYRLPADFAQPGQYDKYQLPGGDNYRELLLTLPTAQATTVSGDIRFLDEDSVDDFLTDVSADGHEDLDYGTTSNADGSRRMVEFRNLTPADFAVFERFAKRYGGTVSSDYSAGTLAYKSPHWQEPNVLAHIRFNDRTDADGKRVLFVEELQSDWAQQGKRDGFAGPAAAKEELAAASAAIKAADDTLEAANSLAAKYNGDIAEWDRKIAAVGRDPRLAPTLPQLQGLRQAAAANLLAQVSAVREAKAAYDEAVGQKLALESRENGIARAPFVGKTDAWLSLAVKRVISYAAQNGYERVAFVNGQQSADRYDLSKQVDRIRIRPMPFLQKEKTFGLTAFKGNEIVVDRAVKSLRDLDDLIGKDAANIARKQIEETGAADLAGADLKVGGEGMKAFYDKIVPNTVNDVLKKLGGGKIGTVALESYNDAKWGDLSEGIREFNLNQPSFDITPALRERAAGGLPLFSRSPADISRQVGGTIKALTVTSVKNKAVDYRGLGVQFLGRRQLVEVYGELFPQGTSDNLMEQYNKLAMRMDADKNDTSAQADKIATEWGHLADERQLAELMHDATRLQIDPRKDFVIGDIRTNYTELRARYLQLSAGAKTIFDKASAAYEKHYDAVRTAVHQRIGRAMEGNPNKASMLARMDAEFFGTIKGIYFPLARFGDYMIQVNWRGANPREDQGQAREAIHFAETMNEAHKLRAELLKQYPADKGFQVAQVTRRAEYNAARDSVGRGFLQQMFNMFKTTGMDPSLQDAINQLYLTSLPDLSWAKHGIHRKGTPGFSQEARRAFANHMFHGARYLAKLNYADQLTQALDDMQSYANAVGREAGYDQVKAQQVVDEMVKRHDLYMNPKNSKLSNWLTSMGFVFYLGLSPASAAVNLTQTALVAYPILGARYGFGKAAAALLGASKQAMQGHNDMSKVLKGDELRAYAEWVKSGLVDVTLAHDLASVAAGNDNALHGAMGGVMKAASFMFHHAERFNRQATALASYRLAREKGMGHDAAYAASVNDTIAAHFDYSSGNRARVMQGDVARVLLLFKQYGQNMIYTFTRNAILAVKGDRQAAKTIAGLLTSHALAAGVLGLPVVGLLLSAASLIGGSGDDPWDAEIALRNLLAQPFGDKAGEVAAHGLSRLTPWDISARVGLNSLLLPDVQEGLEGVRLAESTLTGLLGPVAGIGVNAAKGVHTILSRGDWQRGLEEMMPAALRGPLKALRYAQEGIQDKSGVELLADTTLAEDAGQVLGFSPSRGREAQAGKSAIYQTDKALQARRTQLIGQFVDRVLRQEDTGEQLASIAHFNSLHPNRQIGALHLQHSIRLRMQHRAQAKDGIFLPKARGLDARAAGAFADGAPD